MVVGVSGVLGVLVASAGWGSNYVVVKKYDMDDGLLFQLWMCTGLLCVGIATLFVAPPAEGYVPGEEGNAGELRPRLPLLCVGSGALWSLGNLVTVEVVRTIGLGLGIALWSGSSLLLAFVLGRFATCFGDECLVVMPLAHGARRAPPPPRRRADARIRRARRLPRRGRARALGPFARALRVRKAHDRRVLADRADQAGGERDLGRRADEHRRPRGAHAEASAEQRGRAGLGGSAVSRARRAGGGG
jgi:hypothetical protein